MDERQDIFTEEEKELAEEIIRYIRRETAKKYSYLEKAIFYLAPEVSSRVRYIGANYKKLYYNPQGVTELYASNPDRLENALLHAILHCMLLHPSVCTSENDFFDYAADVAVNAMLENNQHDARYRAKYRPLMREFDCGSAIDLYNKALTNNKLKKQLHYLGTKKKLDDHCVWYKEDEQNNEETGNTSCNGNQNNGNSNNANAADIKTAERSSIETAFSGVGQSAAEADWKQMFAAAEGTCTRQYGTGTGNIFASLEQPDRFSQFSYKEYIRRFAREELAEEDPETIDMLLYTTSMEMYGDTPIVEWNEIRECCTPSDIIIAIDMSGSCGGEIASNFLRQIYTLFDEMNIRSSVNIHTVFFDTKILEATIIRNKNDADKFISGYTAHGFGGTDFHCVFDYADNFSKASNGKKLKGLFFFSDACGSFPQKKKSYPTTFFVPDCSWFSEDYVPEWVELVHYDD